MRKEKYENEEVENFCDEIEQNIEVSIDIIVMVTIVIICFQ